eukprot:TRINITY_DN63233_c0_g1_i1.p1 TRINITY_DN63233_c0_g1~~TRINITY_DN63233_c0_g1_i1.p1  ORF type:complete len:183 (-),score=42.41 TRINITY_DN63233_c0_g1_i1:127-675(-)
MAPAWSELAAKLPIKRTAEEQERRRQLFDQFDPNGNGYLSLAEVDKGIRDVLQLDALFDAKPAIMRAFQAAKHYAKSKARQGDDYVERSEFRLLLVYLRKYFRLFEAYETEDVDHDQRISFAEFQRAVPKMQAWGLDMSDPAKAFDDLHHHHGTNGNVLFADFADWAIKHHIKLEHAGADEE